ncbi:MAG TPA: group I intron-associated PD-(D/E)XK endonuclease [Candidatus Levybacteria bacterium]|nr:group I intron-associated PD-(D/E)XK endonuclease [Candidatus Levybacteria bacterium]
MNKFKTSAITILTEAGNPLHYKEITRLALDKGILETEGATPDASMNAQIVMEIKNKGKLSDFIRTAPSTYALNPDKSKVTTELEEEELLEEKLVVGSGYIGKAGEFLVCSELLFRGYNASIMSVDTGVDIVATKENRLYGVQVKTARLNDYNTYVFDVRRVSFDRHNNGNTFYIFVLYSEKKTNFLILPYFEIEKKVHDGAVLEVGHGLRYRINIKLRNNNVYLGTLDHEMNYFLNNWSVLK